MILGEPDSGLASVAAAFDLPGGITGIAPLGNGNVNATYLVITDGGAPRRFVLQRLNRQVFVKPEAVMANMLAIEAHVSERLRRGCDLLGGRRWELPRVVRTRDAQQPWVEREGEFWRMITFIEATRSHDVVASGEQAREVGFGLGLFHHLISDLPPARLIDTLEGFHVTPTYLEHYDALIAGAPAPSGGGEQQCRAFIEDRRGLVPVLEQARAAGHLLLRPIHGDPKVNNVMMEEVTGRAVALIDLDTVKPGLIHYDIGDCLRSCCNPLGEETRELEAVRFDLSLCRQVLGGYLAAASDFLTDADYDHLYAAIRLISFELGLRFFSDHLAGNVYFRTDHAGHNLQRARVQFQLTASIEAQESEILALIDTLRSEAAAGR